MTEINKTTEPSEYSRASEVIVHPTVFTVSLLPLGHPDIESFSIRVEWTRHGWAVRRFSQCYDASGRTEWERLDRDERGEEFRARFRFPELQEALEVATRNVPTVVANGATVWDVKARDDLRSGRG
jgi:hypothetical protein